MASKILLFMGDILGNVAVAQPIETHCRFHTDCSLLGLCAVVPGLNYGVCECDPGWTGAGCSVADLEPVDMALGYQNASGHSSWGGLPIQNPGEDTWSLFVSQFSNQCPLQLWLHNSFVARAESQDGPGGPYHMVEEVFPEFHHNPTVVGPTSDGFYLLFMIGVTNKSAVLDCTHGIPSDDPGHFNTNAGRIDMAWSKSPKGPWESRTVVRNDNKPGQNRSDWDCWPTNPSAILLEDDSVMLAFSSQPCDHFAEALGMAFAPHWNATFVQDIEPVWRAEPGSSHSVGNVEDPFLWADVRGGYHIVAHSQGSINVCGEVPSETHACGVHLFAESKHGPWTPSLTAVYNAEAMLKNGSSATFTTRQRPQIVFAEDGHTPRYMVQGCNFDGLNQDLSAHFRTCFFEFKTRQDVFV